MNNDYFHHATFEESEGWAGWTREANGQTLDIYKEGDNHFVAFASEGSNPHGSVLSKELQTLDPEREYWVSLRARQLRESAVIPTLSWQLGDNGVPGSMQVTTTEWQTLHWRFRATQATERLKLEVRESSGAPQLPRGNLAIDDIRIYPAHYAEDFNGLPQNRINPGEQLKLGSMVVTLLPGSSGTAGIHKHGSDDVGEREGEALGLSIGRDYSQRMRIDLPGEFTSVSFAWTWLQKNATVAFFDPLGNCLEKQDILASAGRNQWVSFPSLNAKAAGATVTHIELSYHDFSYLDFFTLKRE